MDPKVEVIFNESLQMERNVAVFYHVLDSKISSDSSFWHELAMEEEYHAVLLHCARDRFFEEALFPPSALDPSIEGIKRFNDDLLRHISEYKEMQEVSKKDAVLISIQIEGRSGEHYFQLALDSAEQTPAVQLLRTLTGEEMNHGKRILEWYVQTSQVTHAT